MDNKEPVLSIKDDDYKCFVFKGMASADIEGYVYAHDKSEAMELIEKSLIEELTSIKNIKIEAISSIAEEKE